jgi:hypothetical protein
MKLYFLLVTVSVFYLIVDSLSRLKETQTKQRFIVGVSSGRISQCILSWKCSVYLRRVQDSCFAGLSKLVRIDPSIHSPFSGSNCFTILAGLPVTIE